MAEGPYNIPRNTKGEGRFFNIFTTRALIETIIFAVIGAVIAYPFGLILNKGFIALIVAVVFGAIGFAISSFKIPDSNNFEITRKAGGEYIDKIIIRYIKFRRRKNRIYTIFTEEKKNGW